MKQKVCLQSWFCTRFPHRLHMVVLGPLGVGWRFLGQHSGTPLATGSSWRAMEGTPLRRWLQDAGTKGTVSWDDVGCTKWQRSLRSRSWRFSFYLVSTRQIVRSRFLPKKLRAYEHYADRSQPVFSNHRTEPLSCSNTERVYRHNFWPGWRLQGVYKIAEICRNMKASCTAKVEKWRMQIPKRSRKCLITCADLHFENHNHPNLQTVVSRSVSKDSGWRAFWKPAVMAMKSKSRISTRMAVETTWNHWFPSVSFHSGASVLPGKILQWIAAVRGCLRFALYISWSFLILVSRAVSTCDFSSPSPLEKGQWENDEEMTFTTVWLLLSAPSKPVR